VQWQCDGITNQDWGFNPNGWLDPDNEYIGNLVSWVANSGNHSISTPGVEAGAAMVLNWGGDPVQWPASESFRLPQE